MKDFLKQEEKRRKRRSRDLYVLSLRRRCFTLTEIGEKVGLSKERVRQILGKYKTVSFSHLYCRNGARKELGISNRKINKYIRKLKIELISGRFLDRMMMERIRKDLEKGRER